MPGANLYTGYLGLTTYLIFLLRLFFKGEKNEAPLPGEFYSQITPSRKAVFWACFDRNHIGCDNTSRVVCTDFIKNMQCICLLNRPAHVLVYLYLCNIAHQIVG